MNEFKLLIEQAAEELENHNFDFMTEAKAIMQDDDAFGLLVESMCEGLDSDEDKADFAILAENSREEFLMESNTSASMNAFAPMQITLLRSIYPRLISRRVVHNKTMSSPVETIGYLRSFVKNAAGDEIETTAINADFLQKVSLAQDIALPAQALDLFDNAGVTRTPQATVDRSIRVESVTLTVDGSASSAETVTVPVTAKPSIDGDFSATGTATHSDGTTYDFTVVGTVNRETGILTAAAVAGAGATVDSFHLFAEVSTESNNTLLSISNTYKKKNIEVSDGEIIHSSLPYTYLKDSKALFNIDAMAQVTNTLGTVFSQVTDIRVMNDLYDAVDNDPSRILTFDNAIPTTGVSRLDHNLEILERINRLIAMCDDRTQFNGNVEFNILANPIDASIIASTNLTTGLFDGSNSKGGVIRNFVSGSISSAMGLARVYSSKLVRSGELLIVPKSDLPNEIVYAQYDYSKVMLGSSDGYVNPENPNITNISMLNRDVREGFRTDAITKLVILNNNT